MAQVWRGLTVEESNVHVHVSALRKVLDDEKNRQSHVVTIPGRGYRLIGLDTAPFIYYIEDVAPMQISSIRYLACWKVMLCAPLPRP